MPESTLAAHPALPGVFDPLRGANGNVRITGPCGDTMEFWVLIQDGRIHRCNFTTDGCSNSLACGTTTCTLAAGAPEAVAFELKPEEVLAILPGFPEADKHCALLAINTLKAAISDYRKNNCPPGTGDEPLSVCQLIGSPDGAVIVTTPQELAAADVRKSVQFCRQLNLPILSILDNMSVYACPKCGETTQLFGQNGGFKTAEKYNLAFLGRIPIAPAIGLCETFCPTGAITMTESSPQIDGAKCIWCCACVKVCTSHAMEITSGKIQEIAEKLHTNFKNRQEPQWF